MKLDTSHITQDMINTIDDVTAAQQPQLMNSIIRRAQVYGSGRLTASQIETALQKKNAQWKALQSKLQTDEDTLRRTAEHGWKFAELRGLRKALHEQLGEKAGLDVADFKQMYGALQETEEAAYRVSNAWRNQQAVRAGERFHKTKVAGRALRGLLPLYGRRGVGEAITSGVEIATNPDRQIAAAFRKMRGIEADIPTYGPSKLKALPPASGDPFTYQPSTSSYYAGPSSLVPGESPAVTGAQRALPPRGGTLRREYLTREPQLYQVGTREPMIPETIKTPLASPTTYLGTEQFAAPPMGRPPQPRISDVLAGEDIAYQEHPLYQRPGQPPISGGQAPIQVSPVPKPVSGGGIERRTTFRTPEHEQNMLDVYGQARAQAAASPEAAADVQKMLEGRPWLEQRWQRQSGDWKAAIRQQAEREAAQAAAERTSGTRGAGFSPGEVNSFLEKTQAPTRREQFWAKRREGGPRQ
jgi:hypothetical protein